MTRGFFDVDLMRFVGLGGAGLGAHGHSWEITAPEIFDRIMGGKGGIHPQSYDSMPDAIKRNIKVNGGMMVASLIGIPLVFKYGKKVLGKTLIRPANKLLAPAGVRL